jgi:histidyl-tRNA synthetase
MINMGSATTSKPEIRLPDILPEDHIYYTFIKKVVRHRCRQSGYRRITPPIFSPTSLFEKALGKTSPILRQGFITFEQEKISYALRPDLTPGIIQAYINNEFKKFPKPVELYAIEQIFKTTTIEGEKQLTQFTQFTVSILGEADSAMDAQAVYLAQKILKDLGILNCLELEINTLGCSKCKTKYFEDLKNFYFGKKHALCPNCTELLRDNPLRLLTCPGEDCAILAKMAPQFSDNLCKDCKDYHSGVIDFLNELEIKYQINSLFIGEYDYYHRTIFRFINKKSAQTILEGGRYNNLTEVLGGSATPAIGFSTNFESLVEIMKNEDISIKNKDTVEVFVAQLGSEAKKKCMSLMMKLREIGVHTIGALGKGSMKEQLALAEKFGASWAILIGQIEVHEGIAIIRNMRAGSQEIVRYDDLVEEIVQRVGEENLDQYSVGVEETVYKGEEELIGEEYAELDEFK